jgi:ribosomal protein L11 methyltransferase
MEWIEVKITLKEAGVEAVAGLLQLWGAGGVAIEDPAEARSCIEQGLWDAHGFSEDYLQSDDVIVKAFFPGDQALTPEQLTELKRAAGTACRVETAVVDDEDWAENWKAFYHVTPVGRRLVVVPSWELYHPRGDELVVTIDPGMAFGTGTHITTRSCLELLERAIRGGENVLDVGTGSGILAIAAAKLGASRVLALDNDPVAVRVARDNIRLNDLEARVTVREQDLADYDGPGFEVVTGNLTGNVILALRDRLRSCLNPGGILIAAGINRGLWPDLRAALEDMKIEVVTTMAEEDWVGVMARRSE